MEEMITAVGELTRMMGDVLGAASVSRIQQPQSSSLYKGRPFQFKGNCYKCGEAGHMARDCRKQQMGAKARVCGICENPRHEAEQCAMRGRRKSLN